MSQHDDDLICVGHVLGAKGLKGWIRVFSHTSPRDNILNYSPWLIDRGEGPEAFDVDGSRDVNQWYENIHVWTLEDGDWRLIGGMARPVSPPDSDGEAD